MSIPQENKMLCDRFRTALMRAGVNIPGLVGKSGVSQATLRRWSRGHLPKAPSVYKVAAALGVTVQWLVCEQELPAACLSKSAPLSADLAATNRQLVAALTHLLAVDLASEAGMYCADRAVAQEAARAALSAAS